MQNNIIPFIQQGEQLPEYFLVKEGGEPKLVTLNSANDIETLAKKINEDPANIKVADMDDDELVELISLCGATDSTTLEDATPMNTWSEMVYVLHDKKGTPLSKAIAELDGKEHAFAFINQRTAREIYQTLNAEENNFSITATDLASINDTIDEGTPLALVGAIDAPAVVMQPVDGGTYNVGLIRVGHNIP